MSRLGKATFVWIFLAWLATTWVGSVLGFIFAFGGMMIFGTIAAAADPPANGSLPKPQPVLIGLWALVTGAIALVALRAWSRDDRPRFERAAIFLISAIGFLLVVKLSLETMKTSWP